MKKSEKFTETLAAPLEITRSALLATALRAHGSNDDKGPLNELISASVTELDGKIDALSKHYGIDSPVDGDPAKAVESYRALLIALASDFVPGFKEAVKKGRPSKWSTLAGQFLVADMDRHIVPGDATKGVAYASAQCAKRAHWKRYVGEVDSLEETIRKGYEAATKYVATLPDTLAYIGKNWDMPQVEWDAHVKGVVEYQLSKQDGEN